MSRTITGNSASPSDPQFRYDSHAHFVRPVAGLAIQCAVLLIGYLWFGRLWLVFMGWVALFPLAVLVGRLLSPASIVLHESAVEFRGVSGVTVKSYRESVLAKPGLPYQLIGARFVVRDRDGDSPLFPGLKGMREFVTELRRRGLDTGALDPKKLANHPRPYGWPPDDLL